MDEPNQGVTVEAQDANSPHFIRITSHGKIQNWVSFALDFFEVGLLFVNLADIYIILETNSRNIDPAHSAPGT